MSLPSVVLWDVGGTLVYDVISPEAFLQRCLAAAGIAMDSLDPRAIKAAKEEHERQERSWRTVDEEKAGYRDIARKLLWGSGASPEQIEQAANAMLTYFDLYTPVPGILGLLDELESHGVSQGVISNWPPSLRMFLNHHGLSRYFRIIVGSGENGIAKPDPEIFYLALRELGVYARNCIYIGDDLDKDIYPAKALGMHTIHFNPRRDDPNADAYDVPALRQRLFTLLGLDR